MDLLRPAKVKGEPWDWATYKEKLHEEQGGSCAWLGRVARGEEPLRWAIPASLELKVHSMGDLRPFFGDTLVFPLDEAGREACASLQDRLAAGLEGMFAAPLDPRALHVTLHDLSNGNRMPRVEREVEANAERCRRIFRQVREVLERQPDLAEIRLEPVRLFNCLNISVLLGYAPASDRDFRLLLNLHEAFDEVRALETWLRPHVTLAYFRPRVPTWSEVEELSRRCATLGPLPSLRLDARELAYQTFEDMNRYTTRFTVLDA